MLKGADGGWTRRVTGLFAVTALVEWMVGVGLLTGLRADERPVQVGVVDFGGATNCSAWALEAPNVASTTPAPTAAPAARPRRAFLFRLLIPVPTPR